MKHITHQSPYLAANKFFFFHNHISAWLVLHTVWHACILLNEKTITVATFTRNYFSASRHFVPDECVMPYSLLPRNILYTNRGYFGVHNPHCYGREETHRTHATTTTTRKTTDAGCGAHLCDERRLATAEATSASIWIENVINSRQQKKNNQLNATLPHGTVKYWSNSKTRTLSSWKWKGLLCV